MKEEKPKPTQVVKAEWCLIARRVYRLDLIETIDFSNPLEVAVCTASGRIDRYTDRAVMADVSRFFGGPPVEAAEATPGAA